MSIIDSIFGFSKSKIEIGFLVFWVGTKCSLRCKDCGNLIPYSKQESYNMEQIIKDLRFLLKNCKVRRMQIQGGEPFTHKEISKLINIIDDLDIDLITITTNGTLRLSDDVIESLKNVKKENFKVVISSYDCVKEKQNAFYSLLKTNGISCEFYHFANEQGLWVNQGDLTVDRNNSDDEVQKLYSECEFKICISLINGELYHCGRAKVSEEVFPVEYGCKEKISVRGLNSKNFGVVVSKFINDPTYKEYCRYCLGTTEKIKPAVQIKSFCE